MSTGSFPETAPRAAAVVVAAGSGRRMGTERRKQYLELCGEPVLLWALRPFLEHPWIVSTVLVLPPEDVDTPPPWLRDIPVRRVAGGAERGDSVWNGLLATPGDVDRVLIHDGARPLVSAEVIDRVLAACGTQGAVAGVPATDTLKEVGEDGYIHATPDRRSLWHAQTPQGFPRMEIMQAYRAGREGGGLAATDDAEVYARWGGSVVMVQGAPRNLKVTRPADLIVAEALSRDATRG